MDFIRKDCLLFHQFKFRMIFQKVSDLFSVFPVVQCTGGIDKLSPVSDIAGRSLKNLLLNQDDLDYVGTRLHGGIYAMRHKKRAIIIAIDERAREINKSNHLNCMELGEVSTKLEKMVCSEFATQVEMPFDEISRWK